MGEVRAQTVGMEFEQRIKRYLRTQPRIDPSAYVAPGATLIGDVTLGREASVWFQTVLRADINRIVIGAGTNIQDGCVVHLADDYPTLVGELVTVGHKAILHACTIGDEVLVGMNAVVLDGAEIGARSIIGAGSLVTGQKKFPEGALILGSPARVVRMLTEEEQSGIKVWAQKYIKLTRAYLAG